MDATADDGDEHNAGDHDDGIKGNDGEYGLDVTCGNGDGVDAGNNGINGNDACVDLTVNNGDNVIAGNDGISNDGDGVNSGDSNNNYGNEVNEGNDVSKRNDGKNCNNDNDRFDCTSVNQPGPCGWKIDHQ